MKKLDKKRLKLKQQEGSAVHERNVLAEVRPVVVLECAAGGAALVSLC